MRILIKNATIVNEGRKFCGSVLTDGETISDIFEGKDTTPEAIESSADRVIDAWGKTLIPGVIDEHVHFREPGLTDKADIWHESRAAVKGGTTSFMDMPNTKPQTTTLHDVEDKISRAEKDSVANYAFYLGLTNENIDEATSTDTDLICGLKLFLGSSTGNMLVNDPALLDRLMRNTKRLIAVHSEDEDTIRRNTEAVKAEYAGREVPIRMHPAIRSEEACYIATKQITQAAREREARLHVMHLSTRKELELFDEGKAADKLVTAETCPQYLMLNDTMYDTLGARMKCNPAIKTAADQNALIEALGTGLIDTIGTDHAPHLLTSKEGDCLKAASGTPEIEYGLLLELELVEEGKAKIEDIVTKTSHNVADIYRISQRGYIRKGYFADLVLIAKDEWTITNSDVIGKCGWTPYDGKKLHNKVELTMVNGNVAYENGTINDCHGKLLNFKR